MVKQSASVTPYVEVRLTADGKVRSSNVVVPPGLALTHVEVVRATVAHLEARLRDNDVPWVTGYLVSGNSNALTRLMRRTWRRFVQEHE